MFYILRFLLGVFEAGFYPGVILYLTYWYPTRAARQGFGLFMSASALAGVLGGPLAGTIMKGMWRERLGRLAMGVPARRASLRSSRASSPCSTYGQAGEGPLANRGGEASDPGGS